jgi:hypothetical protein
MEGFIKNTKGFQAQKEEKGRPQPDQRGTTLTSPVTSAPLGGPRGRVATKLERWAQCTTRRDLYYELGVEADTTPHASDESRPTSYDGGWTGGWLVRCTVSLQRWQGAQDVVE